MLTHKGTKELTTKRLKLRRFTVDDAQDMFNNWASDAEVTKFVSWLPHSTPDLTRELLGKWVEEYEKPDYYSWAIEYNGRLIGSIGAPSITERDERTEIGYCIARDCWNKGITTEALEAVCVGRFELFIYCHQLVRNQTIQSSVILNTRQITIMLNRHKRIRLECLQCKGVTG